MTFCMITTFFGPHSFGGDAAFVDRLSRALARRGHRVHVVYCRDAFEMVRGAETPRPYEPPPGVDIHPLSSPFGALSPLATHQTGRPWFKGGAIRKLIRSIRPDVIHFHNLSLVGGPALLGVPAPGATKLLTTHEHWLVCPLHVLWKLDREVCERPECLRCCLKDRKPPQPWRSTGLMGRSLRHLNALICPSRSTQRSHADRGIDTATTHLPYFLPEDYTGLPERPEPRHERPYFAAAGRIEKIKGFQDAIDAMRHLPDVDLRVAGSGRFEAELRARAAGMPNVHFEGRLDSAALAALFRGARGVVVPSLVFETFGYVVLEAFNERTPVVVRDLGALPELVAESGGGLVFDSAESLVAALRRLADDDAARDAMGEHGYQARRSIWSEEAHLARYFALIDECRRAREGRGNSRKPALPAAPEDVTSRPGPAPPAARGRRPGWHGSPGSPIAGARRP